MRRLVCCFGLRFRFLLFPKIVKLVWKPFWICIFFKTQKTHILLLQNNTETRKTLFLAYSSDLLLACSSPTPPHRSHSSPTPSHRSHSSSPTPLLSSPHQSAHLAFSRFVSRFRSPFLRGAIHWEQQFNELELQQASLLDAPAVTGQN